MRPFLGFCIFLCFLLHPVRPWATPRSFLSVAGGARLYLAETGEVFDQRTVGQLEVGIGTQIGDSFLLEGSFGFYGNQEAPFTCLLLDSLVALPPEYRRTFRIEVNPLMLRLRYARGGVRRDYLKPEFHVGIGAYSVTRWLRPICGIEPDSARDLLAAGEIGAAALFVLGQNFMASLGARYSITQRKDLVDEVDHLDGFGFLLGFRFFLNSPRDEAGS